MRNHEVCFADTNLNELRQCKLIGLKSQNGGYVANLKVTLFEEKIIQFSEYLKAGC